MFSQKTRLECKLSVSVELSAYSFTPKWTLMLSRGGRWVAGVLSLLPLELRRSSYSTSWHGLGIGPKNRVDGYLNGS
jgi:hypothetical protein